MKKIFIIILVYIFGLVQYSYFVSANEFNYKGTLSVEKQNTYKKSIDNIFIKFSSKLKLKSEDYMIDKYKKITSKIDYVLLTKKLSNKNEFIISYLGYLIENEIENYEQIDISTILNDNTQSGAISEGENNNSLSSEDNNTQAGNNLQCNDNEHTENNICVLNVKLCDINNGEGQQLWEGTYWSSCKVKSCNKGYGIRGNECYKPSFSFWNTDQRYNTNIQYEKLGAGNSFIIKTTGDNSIIIKGFTIKPSNEYIEYKVTIKDRVKSIGTYNFKGNTNIENINITANQGQSNVLNIYISEVNGVSNLGEHQFNFINFKLYDNYGNKLNTENIEFKSDIYKVEQQNFIPEVLVEELNEGEILMNGKYIPILKLNITGEIDGELVYEDIVIQTTLDGVEKDIYMKLELENITYETVDISIGNNNNTFEYSGGYKINNGYKNFILYVKGSKENIKEGKLEIQLKSIEVESYENGKMLKANNLNTNIYSFTLIPFDVNQ